MNKKLSKEESKLIKQMAREYVGVDGFDKDSAYKYVANLYLEKREEISTLQCSLDVENLTKLMF